MKKLSLIFLCVVVISACNSDNQQSTDTDPIVGKWAAVSGSSVNPEGQQIIYTYNECLSSNRFEFLANHDFSLDSYHQNPPLIDNCYNDVFIGTWTKEGTDSYTYSYSYTNPDQSPITFTTIFSENNDIMEMVTSSDGYIFTSVWSRLE